MHPDDLAQHFLRHAQRILLLFVVGDIEQGRIEQLSVLLVSKMERLEANPDDLARFRVAAKRAERSRYGVFFRAFEQVEYVRSVVGVHVLENRLAPGCHFAWIALGGTVVLLVDLQQFEPIVRKGVHRHGADDVVDDRSAGEIVFENVVDLDDFDRFVVDAPVIDHAFLLDELFELVGRHRLVEEVSLRVGAADVSEEFDLLLRFGSLGDNRQLHEVGHAHDRFEDAFAAVEAVADRIEELHVDFHHVGSDFPQYVEGGVSAAEIVDEHRESEFFEPAYGLDHLLVFRVCAFGYFKMENRSVETVPIDEVGDLPDDIDGVQVAP